MSPSSQHPQRRTSVSLTAIAGIIAIASLPPAVHAQAPSSPAVLVPFSTLPGPKVVPPAPCTDPNYPSCTPAELERPNVWGDTYRVPEPRAVTSWVQFVRSRENRDYPIDVVPIKPINNDGWSAAKPVNGKVWGDPEHLATELCACQEGQWAFTYDDGPDFLTPRYLDMLRARNATATFFVLGSKVALSDENKRNLKAAYDAGHQIGIHSYTHNRNTAQSTEVLISEILYTAKAIYSVIGKVPRYYRPPFGDIDDRVRNLVLAFGMRTVIWNILADDTSGYKGLSDPTTYVVANGTRSLDPAVWTSLNITRRFIDTINTGAMPIPGFTQSLNFAPNNPLAIRAGASIAGPYAGFISLEHETSEPQLDAARIVLPLVLDGAAPPAVTVTGLGPTAAPTNAVVNFPAVNGGRKFRAVSVAECDGNAAGAYFADSDPMVAFVRGIALPVKEEEFAPTAAPTMSTSTTTTTTTAAATGDASSTAGATTKPPVPVTTTVVSSRNSATATATTTATNGARGVAGWAAGGLAAALAAALAVMV
ncbi:chitin deacetylase [Phlyctochytrium bullatum]|nr:chitin deacetylase [Phlyctochytrium bullatum]